MFKKLLHPDIQQFIRDHENDDDKALVLSHREIFGVPANLVAQQIIARRKAKEKLPVYYNTENILYPPSVNLEQSSSELAAKYKASLISEMLAVPSHGHLSKRPVDGSAIDLTGGFGVDTLFLSKIFFQFHYVEPNPELFEIAKHNHSLLGLNNITYHNTNAETFLHQLKESVTLISVDPSRRTENKKVFTLKDSVPEILSLQMEVFQKTNFLLVKASPLMDIKQAINELRFVKNVFVVAIENEVKELLFISEKNFSQDPTLHAINISKKNDRESFSFVLSEENPITLEFRDPQTYLYEPNAAILKSGAFKTISKRFNLSKIQASTHLYTSEKFFEGFPGRIFKIEARVKPDNVHLKQFLPEGKVNITTRNYPLTVDELKKKTGLKDGGEKYLIGFSGVREKFLVVAERVR